MIFDSGSEEAARRVSTTTMAFELLTVLLGAIVGAVLVLYAAPKGYLGHRRTKSSSSSYATVDSYASTTVQPEETKTAETTFAAEPVSAPAPALYESVQPAPAPVAYSAPSSTSFGAPSISKKPTRTYRRRTAPVRSAAGSKVAKSTKPKKR
jgi:hypothetical protein